MEAEAITVMATNAVSGWPTPVPAQGLSGPLPGSLSACGHKPNRSSRNYSGKVPEQVPGR